MTWHEFLDFLFLRDPNVRYVVLGSILISASAAIVGCFLFLRKRALIGDAIAHSVLPGIALAFILFNNKDPRILLGGAIVTGWLSILLINWINEKTKIKSDTAIGLTLSWFYAIGILLLTTIQKSGNAAQSGLDKFLFGKASSMIQSDVNLFGVISLIIIITVILFYRPLKLISFDRDFALSRGMPVSKYDFLLSTLTVIAVATGIQAVGVVLMAALLITPAAAARFWTDQLKVMILLAGLFGAFSGVFGAFISYNLPKMPTGPWIVVCISLIAIFSFLFGTRKGLVNKQIKQRRMANKILTENLLKLFYQSDEVDGNFGDWYSMDELINKRYFMPEEMKRGLRILKRKQLIKQDGFKYRLSQEGVEEGKRVTRLHRLWEMYLNRYLKIAPDHVHDEAEAIEHVITPEIEQELLDLMDKPERDPHDSEIPYSTKKKQP